MRDVVPQSIPLNMGPYRENVVESVKSIVAHNVCTFITLLLLIATNFLVSSRRKKQQYETAFLFSFSFFFFLLIIFHFQLFSEICFRFNIVFVV